jgi:hypothetical protein
VKDQIRLTTYESSKISLSFAEYQTMKKQIPNEKVDLNEKDTIKMKENAEN